MTRDSGTLGGVGGSGDRGDDANPVSEEGGVMEAIEASMAAVLVGGSGVELPPPSRPFEPALIRPFRPAIDGLGLAIPLLGGLIRFSF